MVNRLKPGNEESNVMCLPTKQRYAMGYVGAVEEEDAEKIPEGAPTSKCLKL